MEKGDHPDIILLLICQEAFEANIYKTKLESESIECFLTNENSATLLPHHFLMGDAGVKIFINEVDLDRAKQVLEFDKNKGKTAIVCPSCNSKNVKFSLGKNKLRKIFLIFISLFAVSPLSKNYGEYKCKDCKTRFKGSPPIA